MKKNKSHRGHVVHKASPRASAAGESLEAQAEKHPIERGHSGIVTPHPEKHFQAKSPAKKDKLEKPTRIKTHRGSGHETEQLSDVPGVKLEIQQFVMQPPAIFDPKKHKHPHLHHSAKRATYDRGA
jgi:hypothetical protein